MTNEEFVLLVEKLEKKAEKNPKSYRFKVLLLTILGYGYILFILGIILFLLTTSVLYLVDGYITFGSLKILIFTLPLSYFIIRSLFVKMDLPEGYYLKENEAPELEKIISDLRKKLKTPKIHAIVLDTQYNAAVLQHHTFGQFGPKKNILIIGIPLVVSMTKEQFTSVLAHELAHISHSDTSFSAMIYRVRETWHQLIESLDEENDKIETFLFRKFLKWFYPKYAAYTFPLARQQEYAADAAAVKVTSPEIVRDTLCTISIGSQYFYQFYFDDLIKESLTTNVESIPYSQFFDKFKNLDDKVQEAILKIELEDESSVFDTHPSLTERVQAIGMKPNIPKNEESAITHFFLNPDAILQYFNQLWVEQNGEEWELDIKKYKRLQELENSDELEPSDKYEKALLSRDLISVKQGAALLEELIDQHPEELELVSHAYHSLGDIYLGFEETIEEGEQLLRKAMDTHWLIKENSLNLLCEYYLYTEQMEKFEETKAQLEEWQNVLTAFEEEAVNISLEDQYVPHNLNSEDLASLTEQLSRHSEIMEAYLVGKFIDSIPSRNVYHLAMKVHVSENCDLDTYSNQLTEKYKQDFQLPPDSVIYILNGYEDFEIMVKVVEGSQVLGRNEQQITSHVTEVEVAEPVNNI